MHACMHQAGGGERREGLTSSQLLSSACPAPFLSSLPSALPPLLRSPVSPLPCFSALIATQCVPVLLQVGPRGDVNVSRFHDRMPGCGGFIDISQNAKKVRTLGTLRFPGLLPFIFWCRRDGGVLCGRVG